MKKFDFFCKRCARHKKLSLLSHYQNNNPVCLACALPQEERDKMGIRNPYERDPIKENSQKQAAKAYSKPLTIQTLNAITGEHK